MPIYEYLCHDCGAHIELIRSMKDADAPVMCAQCESQNLTRMLSLFNASSGGRVVAGGSSGGCAGCAGGSCSSCGH
jgi:putative FmdB family regulatory protein